MKFIILLFSSLFPLVCFSQTITGTVSDPQLKPLNGITITQKGTHQATMSDDRGQFKIKVIGVEPIILFTATNLETLEVKVEKQTELKVILYQKLTALDEVHVIAYGTNTQRNSVGAITKITSNEIQQQPVTNPLAALQGRVAGLSITASSGVPGSSFIVQVRGQNTLNSSLGSLSQKDQPLFIIDGVPLAAQNDNINQFSSANSPGQGAYYGNPYGGVSPFNSINPSDIESIEVLKDADATAIYGSRGGNGVILITTKKGKAGKTGFDMTVDNGISVIGRTMPMMNTQQYLSMRREAFANDHITPNDVLYDPGYAPDLTVFDQSKYTDWKKYFIGNTAHHLNTNAAISGGSDHTQFRLAAGYNLDTYIFPGDYGDNRFSFSSNLHHNSIDKRFTLDFTSSYSYDNNNSSASPNLLTAFSLEPNYPNPVDQLGNLIWDYHGVPLDGSYAAFNPYTSFKAPYSVNTNSLNANLNLSYNILRGLTIRANNGYSSLESTEFSASPKSSQNPAYNPVATALFGNNNIKTWIIEPQVEYKNSFKKMLYSLLVGGTYQQRINNTNQIQGSGYINDELIHSISGAPDQTASDATLIYKYTAVFARLNTRWDGKYILDINARRDGSSRFGSGKQFGDFGSVGAGWIFSEESFIKDKLPAFSYGKLRSSYGITGSDGIGDYNFISRYAPTLYNYGGTLGYLPQNLANNQFGWATTKKLEAALELAFLQDRFLLTTSWYRNRSGNQLIMYLLPDQTGFSSVIENSAALVQNSGWEFTVQAKILNQKDFSWNASFNVSVPRNKLLAFPNLSTSSYATTYLLGRSINEKIGFKSAGVNSTTGLFQFYNKKGEITSTPQESSGSDLNDYQDLGNLDPKFYGGLSNNLNYKNFQLSVFFEFKKQLGTNYFGQLYGTPGVEANQPAALIDAHWKALGDQTAFQKYASQYGDAAIALTSFRHSGGIYSDASYLRLKTVSLSYLLPKTILKKLNASAIRLYVNAQNLFTISRFKGNDPETQNFYGIPTLRTITGGLQLNF
jgi:TonB-linked SusC/RagA family outer membrane protein